MVSKRLMQNLIDNGLQPFLYGKDKKGLFNSLYYNEKKATGQTFGNTVGILDIFKYMNFNHPDANVGIFLKNKNIRKENNGFFILDFDLKGNDTISVFNSVIEKLKKLKLWEQVEKKRNGNGYHLALKMKMADIEKMEYQGKIYCGDKSFVEIQTAGKFLRLCPNNDYIIDDIEGLSINFSKVKYIELSELLSLSQSKKDKILLVSEFQEKKEIEDINIDFNIIDAELETEEEQLLYSYIKSKKMDYDEALKMAYGLGSKKYLKVFLKSIPKNKLSEYENLYKQGTLFEGKNGTSYIRNLIEVLSVKKNVIEIEKYLPLEEIQKILLSPFKNELIVAPTGSGKTHTLLTAAIKNNVKMVFTVPNKAVVQQLKEQWGEKIGASYGNIQIKKQLEKYKVVVSTINKLSHLKDFDLSEYVLVCDEKHTHITTVDFRADAIYEANCVKDKFKKNIDITATPEPLNLSEYENIKKFTKKDSIHYNINITQTKQRKTVLIEKIKKCNSDYIIVLNNDIAFNDVCSCFFKPSTSLNSFEKNKDEYVHILEHQEIPKNIKYLFTTDMFSAGLNLNNTGDITIFINGFADATLIKQFVARFRKVENIKVEIILPIRKQANISKNKMIDYYTKQADKLKKEYEDKGEKDRLFWLNNNGLIQEEYFIVDKDKKNLFILKEGIYKKAWSKVMRFCSLDDLLCCFDKNSYTLTTEIIKTSDEYEIKDDVKFEKEARKIIKAGKRKKTVELIKEYKMTSTLIVSENTQQYDVELVDYYKKLMDKKIFSEDLIFRILENEDFIEHSLYWYAATCIDKEEIINNKMKQMCNYIYKKLSEGKIIKVSEICKNNKYDANKFRKILNCYWETEEIRTGKERTRMILKRNEPLKLSKQDRIELLESGAIFKEMIY
jgi:hypothetical protein